MWIFIALVVGIILFIYSDKKDSRLLDEKTLRPMSEWFVIAASSSKRQQRLMSWSILHQACHTLAKQGHIYEKDFKKLMKTKGFNPANFVFSILDEAEKINTNPDINNVDIQLSKIWDTGQARNFVANSIVIILTKKTALFPGAHQLVLLAHSSAGPQINWDDK
jgi:hypothetical protein